jgi:hypothetical protein
MGNCESVVYMDIIPNYITNLNVKNALMLTSIN